MKRLKKLIEKEGLLYITAQLGYTTPVTIKRWIAANKIPDCAMENVEKLLRSKK